jgi:hypothetical protein
MDFEPIFKKINFDLLKRNTLSLFTEDDGITYKKCTLDNVESMTMIHIYYPKILKIVTELKLFPKELNNIIDEYLIDNITVKYYVGTDASIERKNMLFYTEYCAYGKINNEQIKFCFRLTMHITNEKIYNCRMSKPYNLNCNSVHNYVQTTIVNEENFADTIEIDTSVLIDDQIDFLKYYLNEKYNKSNYFIEKKYTDKNYRNNFHYKKIDNAYYGTKMHLINNEKKLAYRIKRVIINEEHLLMSAQIIKLVCDHTFIIADMLKNILDNVTFI